MAPQAKVFLGFLILKRILTLLRKNHQLFDQKIIGFFSLQFFFKKILDILIDKNSSNFFTEKRTIRVDFCLFGSKKWILKFCTTDQFLIIGAFLKKFIFKILSKNQFLVVGANLQS